MILGSEYNVLEQLNLPSLPVGEATLTTGGAIALAAVVLGTLLAAVVGGKAGERYHRKVDRVGLRRLASDELTPPASAFRRRWVSERSWRESRCAW